MFPWDISPLLLFFLSYLSFLLSNYSSLLPRFQDSNHPIKILRMDLGPPPCSRTRLHRLKTATTRWRARWDFLTGQLPMMPLRWEVDYLIITRAINLGRLRRLPRHQMEMSPMTATQSKTWIQFQPLLNLHSLYIETWWRIPGEMSKLSHDPFLSAIWQTNPHGGMILLEGGARPLGMVLKAMGADQTFRHFCLWRRGVTWT